MRTEKEIQAKLLEPDTREGKYLEIDSGYDVIWHNFSFISKRALRWVLGEECAAQFYCVEHQILHDNLDCPECKKEGIFCEERMGGQEMPE